MDGFVAAVLQADGFALREAGGDEGARADIARLIREAATKTDDGAEVISAPDDDRDEPAPSSATL